MKTAFAPTENYERLLAAAARVEARVAREAGIVLVTGPAGYGKTSSVRRFAVQQNALYLRAKTFWTPRVFLSALVKELGGEPGHRRDRLFDQAIDLLSRETPRPIVIDEADHLARDVHALESARDISDTLENIVLLVGMDRLQRRIAHFPQVFSRVAEAVEFQPATLEDVTALAKTLSEIPIAEDLAQRIHKESQGRVRLILNALGRAEQHGLTNRLKLVASADLNGRPLIEEFKPRDRERR